MAADSIPAELSAACRAIRQAGPADAVAGVQPSFVAAPASTQEASALLRAAAGLNLAIVPRGTGSRLHWGNPPQRCDLVVETTGLDRVVEHAAGDLVATVQAGVSLERLAEVLGAAGQRLALDPPVLELPVLELPVPGLPPVLELPPVPGLPPVAELPSVADGGAGREPRSRLSRGTVGGVLATGAAGPLRLRYGSPRDLLIGITMVRADGTVARSGGKVVKNVAGYDLGKLFAGSRGTLGLITQATFRLHPVPAESAYVTVECDAAAGAARLLQAALDSPLAPVAAELDWPAAGAPLRIGVLLEGDPSALAERVPALISLLEQAGGQAVASRDRPDWWGAGPAARATGTVLQIAYWPGNLGQVLTGIRAAATAAGLDPPVGGSAAAGLLHAALPADAGPASVAAFVGSLRATLGHVPSDGHIPSNERIPSNEHGHANGHGQLHVHDGSLASRGSVVVLHAPPEVGAAVDLFGPVPSLGLMRSVKAQFDPDRAMAPGRFAGGI